MATWLADRLFSSNVSSITTFSTMIKLITYCILIAAFISYSVSFAQNPKTSAHVDSIIKELQQGNRYETAVHPDKTKSKQIQQYNLLKQSASDAELVHLTKHKNGVVRVYSFMALSERRFPGLYKIILEHIDDKEIINCHRYGSGFIHSIGYEEEVAEFFVRSQDITNLERQSLDSALIFSNHYCSYTDYLLEYKEMDEKCYYRIKKITKRNKYKYAVIALARFKKNEDLALIENKIKNDPSVSIKAIEVFPNQYFKNILNYFNANTKLSSYELYSAVAVYKDSFSYNYLYRAIKEVYKDDILKKQQIKRIYMAIEKYKSPIYDNLFFEIWKNYSIINDSVFIHLQKVDEKRCASLSIKSLMHSNEIDRNMMPSIEKLLNLLIDVDSTSAKMIIKYNIYNANSRILYFFTDKAKYFKDIEIIESMFMRLETTNHPYVFIPIIETILSYNDNQLNKRLISTINMNKKIDGWGLERVIKMMELYGLKL